MTAPAIDAGWLPERGDVTATAYVAVPAARPPRGGVLVVHEGFGLNAHITWICRRFAGEGYAVVAPDLYWRRPDRVAPDDDRDRAVAMLRSLPDEQVLDDLRQGLALLAERAGQPCAVVGFRIGGRYALLLAAREPARVAAAVSYYGSGIDAGTFSALWTLDALTEVARVPVPLQLVFAGDDPTVPAGEVDRIDGRLRAAGRTADVRRYPTVRPGFLFPGRATYSEGEAADAWASTLAFLAGALHRPGTSK